MLRERLLAIVDQAVPKQDHLNRLERIAIVEHLLSDEVQVKELEDLEILTETMLPSWLAMVPRTKLLKAFIAAAPTSQTAKHSTSAKAASNRPLQTANSSNFIRSTPGTSSSSTSQTSLTAVGYEYRVQWNMIPEHLLNAMQEANNAKASVSDSRLRDFRYAIALDLMKDYEGFKENNPDVDQKTPGIKIYREIAKEVKQKYKYAIRESLNNMVFSDGTENFVRKLAVCCENKTRDAAQDKAEALLVKRAKGNPGIIPEQYSPKLTSDMLTRQKLIRQNLKAKYDQGGIRERDIESTEKKMKESYELQRQDILICREKLTSNDSEDGSIIDDPEETKALQDLIDLWPLLFQVNHINNHNKRLSGLDLQAKLAAFCNRKPLHYLSLFLTTGSKTNMENLALKLNLESKLDYLDTPNLFLLCTIMLSNHFKEPYDSLFKSVEKTTQPDELANLPTTTSNPCIISLGDLFVDEGYFVVVDKICLTKTKRVLDAFLVLVNTCFVLDLEYPPEMPLTFEFLERVVLEMAIDKTRCKKKGKVLLVLTKDVKDLAQLFVKFSQYMDETLD